MSSTDERRNVEHIAALLFTIIGGVFWITTALVGTQISLIGSSPAAAFVGLNEQLGAWLPLIYTVGVLIIGYFQERIAAMILAAGAVGTIVVGLPGRLGDQPLGHHDAVLRLADDCRDGAVLARRWPFERDRFRLVGGQRGSSRVAYAEPLQSRQAACSIRRGVLARGPLRSSSPIHPHPLRRDR